MRHCEAWAGHADNAPKRRNSRLPRFRNRPRSVALRACELAGLHVNKASAWTQSRRVVNHLAAAVPARPDGVAWVVRMLGQSAFQRRRARPDRNLPPALWREAGCAGFAASTGHFTVGHSKGGAEINPRNDVPPSSRCVSDNTALIRASGDGTKFPDVPFHKASGLSSCPLGILPSLSKRLHLMTSSAPMVS